MGWRVELELAGAGKAPGSSGRWREGAGGGAHVRVGARRCVGRRRGRPAVRSPHLA